MAVMLGLRPKLRFRFWRNRGVAADRQIEVDELETAITVGLKMLREGDRWLMIVEDPSGEVEPWFYGNDTVLGQQIARDDYGRKLPEGELSHQARHGVRVPPELFIPTV